MKLIYSRSVFSKSRRRSFVHSPIATPVPRWPSMSRLSLLSSPTCISILWLNPIQQFRLYLSRGIPSSNVTFLLLRVVVDPGNSALTNPFLKLP